ncbi:hypothetical protein OsI_28770 [Oryza sativa Indica Group]|uniref:DUF659 domain-containing protein n=1 Tax=Oryza sativa subsp. indica TaxID=39946 RepID=B8B9Q3_ORYSI|nr:hypothetical protein OsI_28770 [Oryza sativa Indica Group]
MTRAEAISARNLPKDIPLPTESVSRGKRRAVSAIESSFNLDARAKLDALIARMFYTSGIPFNVARNPYFRKAFQFACNNQLGGYTPPNFNKLRTTLLVQERTNVERLLNALKSTWSTKGVSIVSDGWSDAQRRPILNFLAVTEDGPMFLKAINTEGEIKRKEYIAEKMFAIIEEVGPNNVVQVITDNASNCRAAGLMVEQKYSHIFWTPCVVHTLNLALKSICAAKNSSGDAFLEFQWISEVAADASAIKNFIMNHSMRLSMFNDFSKLKFLAIADTRFASTIVMLKRFRAIKENLILMVASEKWNAYREDNQVQAQHVKEKILNDLWYYYETWLEEAPNCQAPHMDEEISDMRNKCFRRYFSGDDLRKIKQQFADFSLFGSGFNSFDSIEDRAHMNAKQWWGIYGNSALELKKLALKLLGQPTSSSCAERNWSTYGFIHSSMRNKFSSFSYLFSFLLRPARAEDLVFVHQNMHLLPRRSEEYYSGPSIMWDVAGDRYELFDGGADFLQQAELTLDEPDLERLLEDLGALDIQGDNGPSSTSVPMDEINNQFI